MALPLKQPLRKLSISPGQPRTESDRQKAAQERYFVNTVKNNKRFPMIIAHLAKGIQPSVIASHFAQQGWISCNERTFTECLRAYRRMHSKDIAEVERNGLDAIVDPNQPESDALKALHQLLSVQMLRISIDVGNERTINKLFNTTHKEMEIANKLIETIAKIEGRLADGNGPTRRKGEVESTGDVSENLNSLRKSEGTMNRMHNLTRQLMRPTQ